MRSYIMFSIHIQNTFESNNMDRKLSFKSFLLTKCAPNKKLIITFLKIKDFSLFFQQSQAVSYIFVTSVLVIDTNNKVSPVCFKIPWFSLFLNYKPRFKLV